MQCGWEHTLSVTLQDPLQHVTVLVLMRRPGQVKPGIRIYVLTLAALA